jgi:hypothetical protein
VEEDEDEDGRPRGFVVCVVAQFARPRPSYAAQLASVMRGDSGSFRFMLRGYSKLECAMLRMGKRGLVGRRVPRMAEWL